MRSNKTTRRRGVTLVELLIVMGVLTILATLSLTTVKGLLKDQKISQAGRLVEQYFESARIRALTNGRPVAVFLERVDLTGDASGRLRIAQREERGGGPGATVRVRIDASR